MSPPTYSQRKAYAVPPPSSAFFDRLVFYKILACLSGASDMLYNHWKKNPGKDLWCPLVLYSQSPWKLAGLTWRGEGGRYSEHIFVKFRDRAHFSPTPSAPCRAHFPFLILQCVYGDKPRRITTTEKRKKGKKGDKPSPVVIGDLMWSVEVIILGKVVEGWLYFCVVSRRLDWLRRGSRVCRL